MSNTKKCNKKEKLDLLKDKILNQSMQAMIEISDVGIMMTNEHPIVTNRLKNASIKDLIELKLFYFKCYSACKEGNHRKLESLSSLELDSITVEDFMDRKLLTYLVTYNDLSYEE